MPTKMKDILPARDDVNPPSLTNPVATLADVGGGGGIASINGDANAAQVLATGTAGADFAIVNGGGGLHTFNLPDTSPAARGVLNPALPVQVIGGIKAFVDGATALGAMPGDVGVRLAANGAGAPSAVAFAEALVNGTNEARLKGNANIPADFDLVLPPDGGTADQLLGSAGAGALEWRSPANLAANLQVADASPADPGTSALIPRADHKHNVPTAAPIGSLNIGDGNADGAASTLSRSDHQHQFNAYGGAPTVIGPTGGLGAATSPARGDHSHPGWNAFPLAEPTQVSATGAATEQLLRQWLVNFDDAPQLLQVRLQSVTSQVGGTGQYRVRIGGTIDVATDGTVRADTGALGAGGFAAQENLGASFVPGGGLQLVKLTLTPGGAAVVANAKSTVITMKGV